MGRVLPEMLGSGIRLLLLWLGIILAVGVAIYTAFLFGQAEGRDLWQSPLLPFHLLVQALARHDPARPRPRRRKPPPHAGY